jgi:hypothetical protein
MSGITDKELRQSLGTRALGERSEDGFFDPLQTYPLREYTGIQSTNLEARGVEENVLLIGGGDVELDLELLDLEPSVYTYNQVRKSASGHVTEIDDTPGRQRLLYKHRTGTGIEMMPDGTIIINTTKNMIRVSAGDEKVIIEGDGEIVYHGNLRMKVDGNFDLDVGGDYNVTVGGDHSEDIKGGYRQDINKNFQSIINKNVNQQITGNEYRFVHGTHDTNIKGNTSIAVSSDAEILTHGKLRLTSREEGIFTSPSINIGASNLSVFGDSGTIGGENIIMYNYNMYTGHSITAEDTITTDTAYTQRVNATSMHATTFHGTLDGKASFAAKADQAGSAPPGAGSGGGSQTIETHTAVAVDPKKTVDKPGATNTHMQAYVNTSEFSARKILLDPGNILYNQINRVVDYGGLSDRTLNTREIRSKLRDPANQKNEKFIATVISEGGLSATFSNSVPANIGRTSTNEPSVRRTLRKAVLGKTIGAEIKRFLGQTPNVTEEINIAPEFNPAKQGIITSKTELENGVSMAKFLGGFGNPINFDHVTTNEQRLSIATNLSLHANLLRSMVVNEDAFDDYRLIVAEGVYKATANEVITPGSVNDLKRKGQAVVYELRNREGTIAYEKTWELADWWKDSVKFQKLILDYDTYDPQGVLSAQIIVIMPEVVSGGIGTFSNTVETRFNNFVQSTNELIECL